MFGGVDFDELKEIDNESGTLKVTFEESDERKKRKIEFCEVGCGDFYGRGFGCEQQWWMRNFFHTKDLFRSNDYSERMN